jgi:D-beta-D-heptose 7-phosphate kinase/D-beta-D-heptose 1-phosphate adenosyltransferase
VSVLGAIGQDPPGQRLRELLTEQRIELLTPAAPPGFQTIVKTRIIARHQQVVRVDRERVSALASDQIETAAELARQKIAEVDAVIIEDYGKGFVAGELVRRIAHHARAAGKIVAADPNPRNPIEWAGITAVKPNRSEAFFAAGMTPRESDESPTHDSDLLRAGGVLLEKWGAQYILVTLGEQGMMLFEQGEKPHHIPTKARQVFDVSGAGDTAIALFTLALSAGANAIEAADIANHASAVVVAKLGTATVTPDELMASFRNDES